MSRRDRDRKRATEWRFHLQGANGYHGRTACGNEDSEALVTGDRTQVTCGACKRTRLFKSGSVPI